MKRPLLFALAVIPSLLAAQTVLYSDDFESYTVATMIAQNNPTNWNTWSNAPGGTEDAPISDAQAQSGSKSIGIVANAAGGGPTDLLLKLGNKTTGSYVLTFAAYIPTGKGGYFNLQHQENVAPAQFAIEVILPASGDVQVNSTGTVETIGTYPHDTWFPVILAFDLDNTADMLTVGSNTPYAWASNTSTNTATLVNQIGAIDFFAYGGGTDMGEMYVDDVSYIAVTPSGIATAQRDAVSISPNPTRDRATVTLSSPLTAQAVIELVDMTGAVVDARATVNGNSVLLDLGKVQAGVYFVRVADGAQQFTGRLVKQ